MSNTKYLGVNPVDSRNVDNSLQTMVNVPATLIAGVAEQVLDYVSTNYTASLASVALFATAAVAFGASDYFTIQIVNRGPLGTGTDVLASLDTHAVSIAAYVETDLAIDATKGIPAQGSLLTLKILKTGSGVVTPPMGVLLRYNN
jgi:hypothetical protein